jgi:hypothetical protein
MFEIVSRLQCANDIEEQISSMKGKARLLDMTRQPFILVVGSEILRVTDFYVVFDNNKYKLNSFLKAVDICFRLFHAFNVKYPVECVNLWTFLQWAVYGFETKWDSACPVVRSFMADLDIPMPLPRNLSAPCSLLLIIFFHYWNFKLI